MQHSTDILSITKSLPWRYATIQAQLVPQFVKLNCLLATCSILLLILIFTFSSSGQIRGAVNESASHSIHRCSLFHLWMYLFVKCHCHSIVHAPLKMFLTIAITFNPAVFRLVLLPLGKWMLIGLPLPVYPSHLHGQPSELMQCHWSLINGGQYIWILSS